MCSQKEQLLSVISKQISGSLLMMDFDIITGVVTESKNVCCVCSELTELWLQAGVQFVLKLQETLKCEFVANRY